MIRRPDDPQQMFFTSRAEQVAHEPLVQTVAEVVKELDLRSLYARFHEGGRSFYDPAMMLSVLFFAYAVGVRSCREIAGRITYDLRFQYFTGSLQPDFRTINRFRHDHLDLLGDYFAQVVAGCLRRGVLDESVVAIDGTKLRASSARSRTLNKRDLAQLAGRWQTVLQADAEADEPASSGEADEPVSGTGAACAESSVPVVDVAGSGKPVTDPDARFMKQGGRLEPCYNGQVVVEGHQFIVAVGVSQCADDAGELVGMLQQTEHQLRGTPSVVLADGGYYAGRNLQYAETQGIDLYLPIPRARAGVGFGRELFVYEATADRYRCPEGAYLHFQYERKRNGVISRVYRASAGDCRTCPCHDQCTRKPSRELQISAVYWLERQMQAKLATAAGRQQYDRRKGLVEAVFGNLKFNLGFRQFHLRGKEKVRGEFLLMCVAHNLKKLARFRTWWRRAQGQAARPRLRPVPPFLSFLGPSLHDLISSLSCRHLLRSPALQ